jgi:peptide/nickel transport system permease protein
MSYVGTGSESTSPAAGLTAADGGAPRRADGLLAHLRRRPRGWLAIGILCVLAIVAVAPSVFAPDPPLEQDLSAIFQPPSDDHLLGADGLGRDQLSRLIHGVRVSLVAALEAVGIAMFIGVPIGLVAGYTNRRFDLLVSRVYDALMGIPGLVVAIAVVAVLGPGITKAMLALGVVLSPVFFRISRAAALDVRHASFIEASIAMGCRPVSILVRHVFPNSLPPLVVQGALALGYALLAEAGLSFLGLGVQPPTASLGTLLSEAASRKDLTYLLYPPGITVALCVLAFTLLGDVLSEGTSVLREER